MSQSSDELLSAVHRERLAIQLWQTVGAAKLANQIVSSLGSQSLHALERVRDEKLYLATGFETFAEFLDKHPDSPMGHDTFRRRINLLNSEGEIAFDLLNSLNLPLSHRKLLAGQIQVTENEIKIGDDSVSLDDRPRITELISKLHAKSQEQQRTIERGRKDNEKWKRKATEAEQRAVIANPDSTETGQVLLTAVGALERLLDQYSELPAEHKAVYEEPIFEMLRMKQLQFSAARTGEKPPDLEEDNAGVDDEAARLMEDL